MSSVLSRLRQPLRRGEVEDLRGLTIDEPIELQGGELPNLDFSGTTFNAPVALREATFQGLAWFTGATFNAPLDLSGAVFLNDGRFERACFRRLATLLGRRVPRRRQLRPGGVCRCGLPRPHDLLRQPLA